MWDTDTATVRSFKQAGAQAVRPDGRVYIAADDVDGVIALLTDDAWLAMPPAPHAYQGRQAIAAFLRAQGRSVAVPVDELIGQQLVLLRPLRGVLSRIENMTGIALLAGGDVGMVVSANMLCAANGSGTVAPSLRM